ncbi:MAG: hypothetical protein NT092_11770 [Bacteroidia bacterium]|nr:hypothetical protein [Bacteroidia bacterium]
MMKRKVLISLIILSLAVQVPINGQRDSKPRDKYTLLTMPYNQRPLTLYRGHFQVNAGYKFAVRARTFDKNGDLIVLKDEGTASVFHYYFLQMKYGITNFLELSVETNYLKHGVRSLTTEYYSLTDNITVNSLTTKKGMGDLLLLGTARLPITYKWFDFALKGGMFVPTAKYEPLKPTHTVTSVTAVNTFTVNYHYNNTNGYGVPVYILGAGAKFSFSKLSLETDFSFRSPVKEGENIRWNETLTTAKTFTYSNKSYKYLLDNTVEFNASLHFQATGWFNIELNSNYSKSKGGWTENLGNKYRNPEEYLFSLEPACEIQISPALKIYELAGFPLLGKNRDAPFYIFITLSYNLFPFLR